MARTANGRVKEGWRWHGRCTTRAEADFFAQYGVHSDAGQGSNSSLCCGKLSNETETDDITFVNTSKLKYGV